VAQLCVAALDKGWAIAGEPRLDLSHACSPECINIYGLVSKQILGGCSAIVNGLGTLRNKLGDAHGKGASPVKPSARHAELAVNLAGTTALFLIQTYEANKT
jgi:hypothetical protein